MYVIARNLYIVFVVICFNISLEIEMIKSIVLACLSAVAMLVVAPTASMAVQVCTTEVFSAPQPGGGCCDVTVTYCHDVVGGTLVVSIGVITVPDDCPIIVTPGFFNWLRKKIVCELNKPGRRNLGIPNCPTTSTITVQTGYASCYTMSYQSVSHTKIYDPCGDAMCIRTCEVCLSTTDTDACSTPANEPMLQYVGCSNSINPCIPGTGNSGCNINTCDSN